MKKEGFPPIIDNNTELLILGTMPGDESIRTGEYYANSKNQFWKIIFSILSNGNRVYSYSDKTKLLLDNNIGVWDVLNRAKRHGSLDSNINSEELNDLMTLFKDYPSVKRIAFNGQKAVDYFKKLENIPKDKEYYFLPSTSSANTHKSVDEKISEWKGILI